MNRQTWPALGLAMALLALASPKMARAAQTADFALGANAEAQACRAVARFDTPRGARAADIYCGAWESPSGRVTLFTSQAQAAPALAALCQGDATALTDGDFADLKQIACARTGQSGPRRYAMVGRRGGAIVVGEVYPSDWAPLVRAAKVLAGAAHATTIAASSAADTPGMREIQAVFPSGPPGQGAASQYDLLRRRAYEYNLIWSFGSSQRDFEALLRTHQAVAPDDTAGEAEILAEIGLNMSSARRFNEAAETLKAADDRARAAGDALLITKIANYRAIDQLNQRHFTAALRLALAANKARADLAHGSQSGGASISANDVGRVERRAASFSQRSLLVSLSDAAPADKAAILSAQGAYIAGVAARGLGRPDARTYLTAATRWLNQVSSPPAWLTGDIANELADVDASSGDFAAAASAAQAGLTTIRTVAPKTRGEAHLLLTLENAQAGLGRMDDALASGRAAMAIFARQTESPGLPPDVAAGHLTLLEAEWRRTGDVRLASEYFQTLALVWDGAAARTTAQLAARLVLRQAGDQARAYQDAERAYRAAFARRQLLAGDPDTPKDQLALADAAIPAAAAHLAATEGDLRAAAPAYLELLNPAVSTEDLVSVLADHEAYLRIAMASGGGFGALVDKSGVHPFLIALTGKQVDDLADGLRRSTRLRGKSLPDYDLAAAHQLYAALIAPVGDRLADAQDLDVDVSGALASIPFAELVVTAPDSAGLQKISEAQDYTGVDWLARHVSVAEALGPASFVRLRKAPPEPPTQLRAAIYGDYQPNPAEVAARLVKSQGLSEACRKEVERSLAAMGALPDTADEARGVAANFAAARLSLGKDFTDADFMHSPDTANADVILLATHGVLALSSCFAEPALLTSVGDTGDGLIEASELLDRQLKARLVVLSACDTAGGGKLDEARTGLGDGGDALSGLARGFIYAGARDVLATEWTVDSASTGAEISDLLAGANQPGVSLRKALSDAQSKLYDQPETAHPFYWAAFILVGDGGGMLAPPLRTADAGK
ncbi:MAG TPA: CHAT domain-containing protein [Caulobacteraceae bacterium]